jgi:hypothetical protein
MCSGMLQTSCSSIGGVPSPASTPAATPCSTPSSTQGTPAVRAGTPTGVAYRIHDEDSHPNEKRLRLEDTETLRCNKSELFLVECELSRDSDELSDSATLSRVKNAPDKTSETTMTANNVVTSSGDNMNVDGNNLTQNGYIQVSFQW